MTVLCSHSEDYTEKPVWSRA